MEPRGLNASKGLRVACPVPKAKKGTRGGQVFLWLTLILFREGSSPKKGMLPQEEIPDAVEPSVMLINSRPSE